MTCQVTGLVRDREGNALANTEIILSFKGGIVGNGSVALAPEQIETTTDGNGEVSFNAEPGSYVATMNVTIQGTVRTLSFSVGVPEQTEAIFGQIIDQDPVITPAAISEALGHANDAEASATAAQDWATTGAIFGEDLDLRNAPGKAIFASGRVGSFGVIAGHQDLESFWARVGQAVAAVEA